LTAINNKNKVAGLFFDLEKASDYVNHEILLYKLKFYGITDNVCRVSKSYLQHWYHRVKIQNGPFDKGESDWGQIKHCVPQGSILGPLLFLLYINDLPLIIKYTNVNSNPLTILFADYISIIVSNLNNAILGNNFKSFFISTMKWFKANLLSLNLEKSYCMEFNSKQFWNTN
jgi:hypothetical protein